MHYFTNYSGRSRGRASPRYFLTKLRPDVKGWPKKKIQPPTSHLSEGLDPSYT